MIEASWLKLETNHRNNNTSAAVGQPTFYLPE
jgi:hypothetical protein